MYSVLICWISEEAQKNDVNEDTLACKIGMGINQCSGTSMIEGIAAWVLSRRCVTLAIQPLFIVNAICFVSEEAQKRDVDKEHWHVYYWYGYQAIV